MSMAEDLLLLSDTAALDPEIERLEEKNRKLREEVEDQESKKQRQKKLYEQAVIDLRDLQKELEASTQQVEGLHKKLDEARTAELAIEMRKLESQRQRRPCKRQEL